MSELQSNDVSQTDPGIHQLIAERAFGKLPELVTTRARRVSEVLIPNDRVACTPFRVRGVRSHVVSPGVLGVTQKTELTKLRVVYADDKRRYAPGYTVWVHGEAEKDLWAKPYELVGRQVVLVPLDRIYAYETTAPCALCDDPEHASEEHDGRMKS